MKTKMKPMIAWVIWAGGLSLVMGIVTHKQLIAGFQSDTTGMSYVIVALFVTGLISSFLAAKQLHDEWDILTKIKDSNHIPQSKSETDLAAVFQRLDNSKNKGEPVNISSAIDTYHSKHNSRARSVSIMAALVISMGLLGTVVGLIISISGLGDMVENIGLSRTSMMEALKMTVSGMGTAFYTTFFGALGGLILRAVAVSQLNALSELCAEAEEYAGNNLVPVPVSFDKKFSEIAKSFEGMQQEIETITARLSKSFETIMTGFGETLTGAGKHALEATQNTFTDLNQTIGTAGEGINDAFGILNGSVKQSSEVVTGSLGDFKLSIDNTSLELNEAVGELHTAIGQATGEMVTMAKAKLDTEAIEIAGQLSLASEAIQTLVKNKTEQEA